MKVPCCINLKFKTGRFLCVYDSEVRRGVYFCYESVTGHRSILQVSNTWEAVESLITGDMYGKHEI